MLAQLFNNPASFAIWVFAMLVAITVHEYAHARTADYLGDPTPRLAGRVTLNPLAHLDPVGTLMLILVIVLNVSPAIFNLIPIHPLDGGKVLIGILPEDSAKKWDIFLSRYGFI